MHRLVFLVCWVLCCWAESVAGEPWEAVIERVSPSITSLRVTTLRDFDTEQAGTAVGTGFVVDAKAGLILTNRHLVQPGPVSAEAIFITDEVVQLTPVYRDPVHDFGLYRYDPRALRHVEPISLSLRPDQAHVGADIRVIGSDGGEKLAILGGTLARLDRAAPFYGRGSYNDFNTHYMQAATNTSGGSSGAPVVNALGDVVALNAGGSIGAASSYYLPLDRVTRALALIQRGETVSRGGLQATFRHVSFRDLRLRGLAALVENTIRDSFPECRGLLVVDDVAQEGSADGLLEPGDVLLALDDQPIITFEQMDQHLDERVGQTTRARLIRLGETVTHDVLVADLHALSPASYLELGGGVLHDVSYQQARSNRVAQRGVFVSNPGYMLGSAGIPDRAVITALNGQPTDTLDQLVALLTSLHEGASVRVRFHLVGDDQHAYERVATMDRTWHPLRRCTWHEARGDWPCVELPDAPDDVGAGNDATNEDVPSSTSLPMKRAARSRLTSLVWVESRTPYPTAGHTGRPSRGVGVIVDREHGLVLTSRSAVPVALSDVSVTLQGVWRTDASVVALHPTNNLVVIEVDPRDLASLPVEEVRWARRTPGPHQALTAVGFDSDGQHARERVVTKGLRWLTMPLGRVPAFAPQNLETLQLASAPSQRGGVLLDKRGRACALWAAFDSPHQKRKMEAIPVEYVHRFLATVRQSDEARTWLLGAALAPLPLADARARGLSVEWVQRLQARDPEHRVALEVQRVTGGTSAAEVLREGDFVVSAHGEPMTRAGELHHHLASGEPLPLLIVRDGVSREVVVTPTSWPNRGLTRVVTWSGAVLHQPHREVLAQHLRTAPGVYVSWRRDGSAAAVAGLRSGERIVQVNGLDTPSLDAFLDAVRQLPPTAQVVLRMEGLDRATRIRSVRLDGPGEPGQVIERDGRRWTRQPLTP